MSKQIKAILTIIAGTIGVGFLALPYSVYRFGTVGGIILLVIVGFLTLITNVTYSDIITSDKGNRQVPGYVKKYLGRIPAHLVTIIIIAGSIGILLAYGLVSGSALKTVLLFFGVNDFSTGFLGFLFIVISLLVMRYGVQIISKASSWAVIALVFAIIILLAISIPNVNSSNITSLNFDNFSLLFGVSVFALYSAGSIPVIDEIIGYERKKYRRVITIATLGTLLIYIIFTLILSLSLGDSLTSELVNALNGQNKFASLLLAVLTLLATFTSFILIANNVKEVLNYDYKVPARTSIFLISAILIWALILDIANFEILVSVVGNLSLALQSLAIFAVWFISQKNVRNSYKLVVLLCGLVLVAGIVMQI